MPDGGAVRCFPFLVALIAALGGCSSKPPADIEARIAAMRPDLAAELRASWPSLNEEEFAAELERAENSTAISAATFHVSAIQVDIVDEQVRGPWPITLPATAQGSVTGDLTFPERHSIVEHAVLNEFASKLNALWPLRDGLVIHDVNAKEFMHGGDGRTAVTVHVEADIEGRTVACNLIDDLTTHDWVVDTLWVKPAMYMIGEWVLGIEPEPL